MRIVSSLIRWPSRARQPAEAQRQRVAARTGGIGRAAAAKGRTVSVLGSITADTPCCGGGEQPRRAREEYRIAAPRDANRRANGRKPRARHFFFSPQALATTEDQIR